MPAHDLLKIANVLRADVLTMVHGVGAGHVAGPLSSADIIASLYFDGVLKYDVNNPWWDERDRFILSCGHYAPILYATLARAGYFYPHELTTFMKASSRLPGHPEYRCVPGVEATTGTLGQGVSFAVGQAMAIKLKYGERPRVETPRVYCMLSDGELQEGQVWEAFNTAVRRQLDNLIFILDRNKIQIEHYISQVATYGEISGRLEGFGLHVLEVDGHDLGKLATAWDQAEKFQDGPVMILAQTTAGKGISFMEGTPAWHDKAPNQDELLQALEELHVV